MKNKFINITGNANNLSIQATPGKLILSGRSTSEQPEEMFTNVNNYLIQYLQCIDETLSISFSIEYLNTISLSFFNRIFSLISEIGKTNQVSVSWYYYSMDEDVFEVGEVFTELYPDLKINLIELGKPPIHKPIYKFI